MWIHGRSSWRAQTAYNQQNLAQRLNKTIQDLCLTRMPHHHVTPVKMRCYSPHCVVGFLFLLRHLPLLLLPPSFLLLLSLPSFFLPPQQTTTTTTTTTTTQCGKHCRHESINNSKTKTTAHQARFAWQAWCFPYLHRCPRKLGDELVTWTAGVVLSAPP